MFSWLSSVRKAVASAVGVTITLLTAYNSLPFVPDKPFVVAVLGALTVVATWLVPNKE